MLLAANDQPATSDVTGFFTFFMLGIKSFFLIVLHGHG